MKDIIGADKHLQDVLKNATATSRMVDNFTATHQSWIDRINPIQHDFSHLQASASSSLREISDITRLPHLKDILGASKHLQDALKNATVTSRMVVPPMLD